jgi:hypothetical protein
MTGLGALIGALNQGWVAGKISRKNSIVFSVNIYIHHRIRFTDTSCGLSNAICGKIDWWDWNWSFVYGGAAVHF